MELTYDHVIVISLLSSLTTVITVMLSFYLACWLHQPQLLQAYIQADQGFYRELLSSVGWD